MTTAALLSALKAHPEHVEIVIDTWLECVPAACGIAETIKALEAAKQDAPNHVAALDAEIERQRKWLDDIDPNDKEWWCPSCGWAGELNASDGGDCPECGESLES